MHIAPVRVLLVDDDPSVRGVVEKLLRRAGFAPVAAGGVVAARQCLEADDFDVVVTDINMPGPSGVQFLAELHERDPDLPVILVTGAPQLETAMMAINLGAYRYLTKPIDSGELERTVRRAGLVRSFALLKQRAVAAVGAEDASRLDLDRELDRSIDALWMAFQPIVHGRETSLLGFEALLRSDHPSLRRPDEVLDAAQRLGRSNELGRAIRLFVASHMRQLPDGATMFINLLPSDLLDPELVDPDAPLNAHASRVMLELTERATLGSVPNLGARVRALRELGFRLAIDDLGAGYSGLASITQLEPDVVKLDMSLVRGIQQSEARQAVVRSMVDLCRSMHLDVIAEGIEEPAEADTLWSLGIENLQGYLFGRPRRELRWPQEPLS